MLRAKQTTVADMCGPATLRSSLVSSNANPVDSELESCELIGQGAYGMVHKVQEKATGQCKVLKSVVRPESWDDERLKMEAQILQNLDHPHILRIFSWYEENDCVNIVMEHCDGGELLNVIRDGRRKGETMPEKWAATAIRQSFQALVYIHQKGVVHKDLKGQNLLLLHSTVDNKGNVFGKFPHIVICDLGIAEICCRGIFGLRGSKVAGTPATMAPEVWTGSCSPKSDVWSMGCVMFEMFTNRLPFEVKGGVEAASKQQAKWVALHTKGPKWEIMKCSPEAKHLCQQLLTFREGARPSATECLQHQWLVNSQENELTPEEVEGLCKAVCSWRDRSPCQRAFCLKVAANCTCIDKFAKIFMKFDTDNSGILEKSEVVAALIYMGIDKAMAKKTAAALDVNGDNSCEYLEFTAACLLSLEDQFDELLRQEFRMLDVRRCGSLTDKEFEPLLEELKALAASRGMQLEEIDSDGDGNIDFQEFCSYFGRPDAVYTMVQKEKEKAAKEQQMPMKQHVRIMGGFGLPVEKSMEQIRLSMEQSMEGKTILDKTAKPKASASSTVAGSKPRSIAEENNKPRASTEEEKTKASPSSTSASVASRTPSSSSTAVAGTPSSNGAKASPSSLAAPAPSSPSRPKAKARPGEEERQPFAKPEGSVASSRANSFDGSNASGRSVASSLRPSAFGGSVLDSSKGGSGLGSDKKDEEEEDTVAYEEDSEPEEVCILSPHASILPQLQSVKGFSGGSLNAPLRLRDVPTARRGVPLDGIADTATMESHYAVRGTLEVPDIYASLVNRTEEAQESSGSFARSDRLSVPPARVTDSGEIYMSTSAASLASMEGAAAGCIGCWVAGQTVLMCGPSPPIRLCSPVNMDRKLSDTDPNSSWVVSL